MRKKRKYHSHFHDPAPEKHARLKASFKAERFLQPRMILALWPLLLFGFILLDCSMAPSVPLSGRLQRKEYDGPRIHEEGVTRETFWFQVEGKKAEVLKRDYQLHQRGDIVTISVHYGRFTGIYYPGYFFVWH